MPPTAPDSLCASAPWLFSITGRQSLRSPFYTGGNFKGSLWVFLRPRGQLQPRRIRSFGARWFSSQFVTSSFLRVRETFLGEGQDPFHTLSLAKKKKSSNTGLWGPNPFSQFWLKSPNLTSENIFSCCLLAWLTQTVRRGVSFLLDKLLGKKSLLKTLSP